MVEPYVSFAWEATYSPFAIPCSMFMPGGGWYAGGGAWNASVMAQQPQGRKAAIWNGYDNMLFNNPKDYLGGTHRTLWFDQGIKDTIAGVKVWCEEVKAAGQVPDMIILDGEAGVGCWSCDEDSKKAMVADKRYPALATKYRIAKAYEDIWPNYLQWNYGLAQYQNAVAKKAAHDVFRSYFPNVLFSNFGNSPIAKADVPVIPDFNGHQQYLPANSDNVWSPVLYAYVNQLGWKDARFQQPWYAMAWQINQLIAAYRVKSDAKLMPWVWASSQSGFSTYPDAKGQSFSVPLLDPAWWTEMMFHACVLCGPQFLWFNHNANYDPNHPELGWVTDKVAEAKNDAEFTAAISGFKTAARGLPVLKPINHKTLINYDKAKCVLSQCVLADGSVLARVTFKPGVTTVTCGVDGKAVQLSKPTGALGCWISISA